MGSDSIDLREKGSIESDPIGLIGLIGLFERVVKPRCKGQAIFIRYADDYTGRTQDGVRSLICDSLLLKHSRLIQTLHYDSEDNLAGSTDTTGNATQYQHDQRDNLI